MNCLELWNGLRELSDLGNKTSTPPNLNDEHGDPINDPFVRTTVFNDHFCNVYRSVDTYSTSRYIQLHVLQQFYLTKISQCFKMLYPIYLCFFFYLLTKIISVRLLSVLHGHSGFFIPETTANDLRLRTISIPDLIHYIIFLS